MSLRAAFERAAGKPSTFHVWVMAPDWVAALVAPEPPEGYTQTTTPRGAFYTLRRGPHVAMLFCYAPPQPAATDAAIRRALEAEVARIEREYPAALAAEIEALRKRAAERGITVTPQSSNPAAAQAGDVPEEIQP